MVSCLTPAIPVCLLQRSGAVGCSSITVSSVGRSKLPLTVTPCYSISNSKIHSCGGAGINNRSYQCPRQLGGVVVLLLPVTCSFLLSIVQSFGRHVAAYWTFSMLLKIHSCGAAGHTGLSVLLFNSFDSLVVNRSVGMPPLTSIDCCCGDSLLLWPVIPVVPDFSLQFSWLLSESQGLPRSHFVALVCTSLIFFKLHSVNAFFFFRCQWHSCGRSLLHFAAGLFLSLLRALSRSIFGNNRIILR
jgi:hypothetical protein